jgi:hypothetical protein
MLANWSADGVFRWQMQSGSLTRHSPNREHDPLLDFTTILMSWLDIQKSKESLDRKSFESPTQQRGNLA